MWEKLIKEKREEFEEWHRKFKRRENLLQREFVILPGYQPDWREEIREKTETQFKLRGKKSLFKWKNFKALFKKKREWWDMLPPKVPPREYRVLYLDIPKEWPIRSLLLEEPDEPKNYMIQSHATEIHFPGYSELTLDEIVLPTLNKQKKNCKRRGALTSSFSL